MAARQAHFPCAPKVKGALPVDEDYNPFQSPESPPPPYLVPQALFRRRGPRFASAHARAVFAMLGLGTNVLADVVCILLYARQYDVLDQRQHGVKFVFAALIADDHRVATCEYVKVVFFYMAVVAFLMWLHRAYRNLSALGAPVLSGSPAWAVGSYFVPFVQFVIPYTMMAEVWRYSYPAQLGAIRKSTSPLVGIWWAAFLLRFAAIIYVRMSVAERASHPTFDELKAITLAAMITYAIDLAAAALAIALVFWISRNQEATHHLIVEQAQQSPSAEPDAYSPF